MKKSDLIFSAILVPLDYVMTILAALTAYSLRYVDWVKEIRPVAFNLQFNQYFNYVWPIALGWIIIFSIAGLYRISGSKSLFDEIGKIFLACSTAMLTVIVGAFFSRELFNSRFILLFAWVLAIVYVVFVRLIIRGIQRLLYGQGLGINRIILIGADNSSEDIAQEIYRNKKLGYQIVARLENYNNNQEKIVSLFKTKGFEEIWQTDSNLSRKENVALLDFANEHHLIFKYVADFFATQSLKFDIYTLAGIPLVEVKRTSLDGWGKILKRLFDIILSVFLLIIFSPVFLILALLIKIDSRGSVFYGAKRIGANGREIKIWKFRSMIVNADKIKKKLLDKNEREDGPLFKMENDPRVTRVGKFIRKWSLDELPQFYNAFNGSMSLVGPRPHEPGEVKQYKTHHQKLLNIKPGITGMAQVSGRSDLEFEEEVRLDTFYIENWSMWLDLVILIKTPLIVFLRKGAK
ncbi:MAG TPA: sugar transferase [bacterium]|nr:sugar transferase [bacterium]